MINQLYMLASANTGEGFFSHFKYISIENDSYQYVLKGAPGTGKSTLLKKIAEYFLNKGEAIEYFYCSSDINSFDGIRIVSKKVSIVDGTAPHTTEATIPLVNSEIINLGECINSKVKLHNHRIIENIKRKSESFVIAYKYLEIVRKLDELSEIYAGELTTNVETETQQIIAELGLFRHNKLGSFRKFFLKAVTKDGLFDFSTINDFSKIYTLTLNTSNANAVMKQLYKKLVNYGYEIVVFYDVINPRRVESIYIQNLDILIKYVVKNNDKKIQTIKKDIDYYLKNAGKNLEMAKLFHKKIENYYIKNLDFVKLDNITQKLITKIDNK